jgi:hypothetical protein
MSSPNSVDIVQEIGLGAIGHAETDGMRLGTMTADSNVE